MGDAVRSGEVPADPEDTIDASDRVLPASHPRATEQIDYAELAVIERRHYALGHEIARGGMGRVLEARDLRLGRQVAIKELLPQNRDVARRFEREARITARLQHPSIIHIYEAGTWPGGEPFYAMPKVSGRSLDAVVTECRTLDDRLALVPNVIAVADALAYAHNANVIHRDLKPANVIIGEFGETVVIDWGLAKDLGSSTDPKDSLQMQRQRSCQDTASGGIIGTPAYMPPEQARGEAVDQRADVYALGALLYKVLVGAPPFAGASSAEVLELVKARPPVPVQERAPGAPSDLVAIAAKAMARDPADRYLTAAELAKDLKRFQTGQLVGAHRYTQRELLARWLRRHRVAVAISSVAVVVLATVGVFSLRQIVDEKERAEHERAKAELGRTQLLEERGRAELLAGHAGAALAYLVGAAHDGHSGGARGFLIADAMRPFEMEVAHLPGDDANVAIAASTDGRYIASSGRGVHVRDVRGVEPARVFAVPTSIGAVAIDPATTQVAGGGEDGVLRVWSLQTGAVRELHGHRSAILDVVFSPDGMTIATTSVDGTARVWNLLSGTAATSTCHTGPVVSARFSTDGARVVTASADTTACVIDARTADEITPLRGHTEAVNTASFSADGKLVITASDDGTARIWSTERGKLVAHPLHHDGAVQVALLFGDGQVLTAGSDNLARVWDLPGELVQDGTPHAAKLVERLTGHTSAIVSAAIGAGDRLLATGAFDGAAKVWDLDSGEPIASFEHGGVVSAVAFVPGSSLLATASRDGAARLWNVQADKARHDLFTDIYALAVAPGGTVAVACHDSRVVLVRDGRERALRAHLGSVYALAFTPDGRRLVSGGEDASPIVWDVDRGERIATLGDHPEPTRSILVAPDGDSVVLLVGGKIEVWSLARVRKLRELDTGGIQMNAIAIGPRGEIGAVGDNGALRLWDPQGNALRGFTDLGRVYGSLAFSPSGDALVAGGTGTADVWSIDSSGITSLLTPLEAATGIVRAVLFTQDASRVITAGDDGRARIWDARKGKLLATRDARGGAVTALAVDRDSLWIATSGGTVGAWDVRVETRQVGELERFMVVKHVTERLHGDDVVRRTGTPQ